MGTPVLRNRWTSGIFVTVSLACWGTAIVVTNAPALLLLLTGAATTAALFHYSPAHAMVMTGHSIARAQGQLRRYASTWFEGWSGIVTGAGGMVIAGLLALEFGPLTVQPATQPVTSGPPQKQEAAAISGSGASPDGRRSSGAPSPPAHGAATAAPDQPSQRNDNHDSQSKPSSHTQERAEQTTPEPPDRTPRSRSREQPQRKDRNDPAEAEAPRPDSTEQQRNTTEAVRPMATSGDTAPKQSQEDGSRSGLEDVIGWFDDVMAWPMVIDEDEESHEPQPDPTSTTQRDSGGTLTPKNDPRGDGQLMRDSATDEHRETATPKRKPSSPPAKNTLPSPTAKRPTAGPTATSAR